jgi:hypothetical protein
MAKNFVLNRTLPGSSRHGLDQKFPCLSDNQDFAAAVLEWVRTSKDCKDGVLMDFFLTHCNTILLPRFKEEAIAGWRKSISGSTAMRWLHRLGLFEDDQKKGAFFDGHERNDYLCARYVFLDAFVVLARRMNCFENVDKETVIPPVLAEGQRRLGWITHDESTFNPLDIYGKRLREGERLSRR